MRRSIRSSLPQSRFRAMRQTGRVYYSARRRRRRLPVTPRGAGTGLVGGAISTGLIIDFSRLQPSDHGTRSRTPNGAGRRGRGARSTQRTTSNRMASVLDPMSRPVHARHSGRHDRQQLLRLPCAYLWGYRRSCPSPLEIALADGTIARHRGGERLPSTAQRESPLRTSLCAQRRSHRAAASSRDC